MLLDGLERIGEGVDKLQLSCLSFIFSATKSLKVLSSYQEGVGKGGLRVV